MTPSSSYYASVGFSPYFLYKIDRLLDFIKRRLAMYIDIILEIAEVADWRTIVRFAGTCRELRKRMLPRHWSAPFVSKRYDVICGILAKFAFDIIDIHEARDSVEFRQVGERIVEIFDGASGRVSLNTSSKYVLEGMYKARKVRSDDGRRYDSISYTLSLGENPNLPPPESLPFDELLLYTEHPMDFDPISEDFLSYVYYCARKCTTIKLHKILVFEVVATVSDVYLVDCECFGNDILCNNLYLVGSTYFARDNRACKNVKNIYIDRDSAFVCTSKLNEAFPLTNFHNNGNLALMCNGLPRWPPSRSELYKLARMYNNIDLYRTPDEPPSNLDAISVYHRDYDDYYMYEGSGPYKTFKEYIKETR